MKNKYITITSVSLGIFIVAGVSFGFLSFSKGPKYSPRIAETKESENTIQAAEWAAALKINPLTGQMDYDCIRQVQRQLDRYAVNTKSNQALSWNELGPDNIGGRVRAILVDKRDTSGNTIYCGGVAGGLFLSKNGGSSWNTVSLDSTGAFAKGTLPVSCITQTVNGDIFVGTGEGHYNGRYQSNGTGAGGVVGYGVYKLTNGSTTWKHLPSTSPNSDFSESSDWAYCNAITSHPTNNNVIYAATNRGLWVSSDGNTFARVVMPSTLVNQFGFCDDVAFCPNGALVASIGSRVVKRVETAAHLPNADGISRIDDSWYTANVPKANRVEIAVSPSNSSVFYTSCSNSSGGNYNTYRTTDGGNSWTVIGPGTTGSSASASLALFRPFSLPGAAPNQNTGQGDYDNIIAVDPSNPDVLYLGGTTNWKWTATQGWTNISFYCAGGFGSEQCVHPDMHGIAFHPTRPNIVYFTNDGGFYRSVNGGATFTPRNSRLNVFQCYSMAYTKDGDAVIAGAQDNGTVLIPFGYPRPSALYAFPINGGDGGYTEISIINTQAQFAATPEGALVRSSNFGGSFADFTSGTMKSQAADFVTPFELWESFNDPLSVDSVNVAVSRAMAIKDDFFTLANCGGNLSLIGTLIPGRDTTVAEFNTAITYFSKTRNIVLNGTMPADVQRDDVFKMPDHVQSRFAAAFGSRIYFTKEPLAFNKAPVWIPIAKNSGSGTGNDNMTGSGKAIAFSRDGDHLYFGTTSGALFRIDNISRIATRGESDTLAMEVGRPTSPVVVKRIAVFPGNLAIMGIGVDPNDANNVVVTLANYSNGQDHIYRSTNALALVTSSGLNGFQSIQGSLPGFPVYDAVIDMTIRDRITIGTENGVWYCNDGFSSSTPTWVQDQSVPHIPVFMVRQNQYARNQPGPNGEILYNYVTGSGTIYAATHGRGIWECKNYLTPLSVEDKNDATAFTSFQAYPNPASERVIVKAQFTADVQANIEVYDMSGRLVVRRTESSMLLRNGLGIDVSDLREGSYIVRITGGTETKTTRFVVSR